MIKINLITILLFLTFQFPNMALAVENPWYIKIGYGITNINSTAQKNNTVFGMGGIQKYDDDKGIELALGHKFGDHWGRTAPLPFLLLL